MAISSAQIQAYAKAFIPVFYFSQSETIFPVSVDSWLKQCAAGDWTVSTDPHRGTTVVAASTPLTQLDQLIPAGGCAGSAGSPLSTNQQLPIPDAFREGDELFLDFAGWDSLKSRSGFTAGDDNFIQAFYQSWFSKLNGLLSSESGTAPQRAGTKDRVPTKLALYCEAAWAGEYTRRCIAQGCTDFAPASTNDPASPQPDSALDPFFVLTYYLFYPCTEPPPGNPNLSPGSPNMNKREGQWEAVSFYFNAAPNAAGQITAADLTLAQDPTGVVPDFAVLSQGILASGDGIDSGGLSADYPAQPNTQAGVPVPTPLPVYVTCGTHKNLFVPTPFTTNSDPNQAGLVAGGAVEAGGSGLAGAGAGALGVAAGSTDAAVVNIWNPLGWILLIIGLILFIIGCVLSAAASGDNNSSTPAPNPQGDTADGEGTAVGGFQSIEPPVPSSLVQIETDLTIFSTPTLSPQPSPPAWWSFPGRWGVAMGPEPTEWDSGAFLTDFKGRTRAYWNTVVLQGALP